MNHSDSSFCPWSFFQGKVSNNIGSAWTEEPYEFVNHYPTLPCPTLPYTTLPYTTLPYPTLPYPTLPYTTILLLSYTPFCDIKQTDRQTDRQTDKQNNKRCWTEPLTNVRFRIIILLASFPWERFNIYYAFVYIFFTHTSSRTRQLCKAFFKIVTF